MTSIIGQVPCGKYSKVSNLFCQYDEGSVKQACIGSEDTVKPSLVIVGSPATSANSSGRVRRRQCALFRSSIMNGGFRCTSPTLRLNSPPKQRCSPIVLAEGLPMPRPALCPPCRAPCRQWHPLHRYGPAG